MLVRLHKKLRTRLDVLKKPMLAMTNSSDYLMNVHSGHQYYVTITDVTTNMTVIIMRYKGVYAVAQLRNRAFPTCLHAARPSPGAQNPPPGHELCSRKPTPDIDGSHQTYRLPDLKMLPNIMLFSRRRTATVTSGLTRIRAREQRGWRNDLPTTNLKCVVRRALSQSPQQPRRERMQYKCCDLANNGHATLASAGSSPTETHPCTPEYLLVRPLKSP